jgi:hypothetical protein
MDYHQWVCVGARAKWAQLYIAQNVSTIIIVSILIMNMAGT